MAGRADILTSIFLRRERSPIAYHQEVNAVGTHALCKINEIGHLTEISGLNNKIQAKLVNPAFRAQLSQKVEVDQKTLKGAQPPDNSVCFGLCGIHGNPYRADVAFQTQLLPSFFVAKQAVCLDLYAPRRRGNLGKPFKHITEMAASEGIATTRDFNLNSILQEGQYLEVEVSIQLLGLPMPQLDQMRSAGRAREIARAIF
ncbi:hypothetical protein AU381_24945 [Sinorhizobium glycinis]|uniref:Uncharacterized protein n=1 Tax=Sinorhizobium glycinis TaxID=1472378 RepID=A0A178XIC1_9HYPH|nr:hypothetical protein AU381_24945 [Sinorhizobium glycinis]